MLASRSPIQRSCLRHVNDQAHQQDPDHTSLTSAANMMLTMTCVVVQELGLGNIERCRGFSSHLFKLLLRQRGRLASLTQHWVHLR